MVLILALLLINNVIINKINRIKRRRPLISFIQNTQITTTIGILVGLILRLCNANTIETTIKNTFEPLFMIVLLPPILFSSALKMNQHYFFKNFSSISLFAFCGTLLAIGVNTLLMYGWTLTGYGLYIPFHYCLVFSTLISATDTVSVLATFEGSQADPNIYSLIFGESIFNDAISLGIYRSILVDEKGHQTKTEFVFDTTARFTTTIFVSTLLGVGIGLLAAYLLKKINKFTSISEAQIYSMSKVLEVDDWDNYNEADVSIESDEKEIHNKEESYMARVDDIHTDNKFDVVVAEIKNRTTVADDTSTDNIEESRIGFNTQINEQTKLSSMTQTTFDNSYSDTQTKTQLRIFKQLVTNFNTYLNQEITISLVSPFLAYLLAEVI